ncbi:zf-TFIIB domain-containing protein [Ottowia testudinis]|uniref:Zf-TFIIB domain-containing protein n=1 Tax=Ottowia testudinis TaxID=2816950 RepID=A0A975CFC7_9BURK|nr:zf-TFIIB domain-containing protein [Ottowia testudinis]QTD45190.1 zf-TFIIB domain-containing protein [Ottowia testudinis]
MTANLHCDCAAHSLLKPTTLEPGLFAATCPDCGAVLLKMDDWRRWRGAQPASDAHAPLATTAADHTRARPCPACARLMERLSVDAGAAFRIDRCGPCQHLWLDAGEWPALMQSGLALHLDALLSDGGQRRLQAERLQASRMQALRQRHGDACIDEIVRIQHWLAEQPHRDELLALLRSPEPLGP